MEWLNAFGGEEECLEERHRDQQGSDVGYAWLPVSVVLGVTESGL